MTDSAVELIIRRKLYHRDGHPPVDVLRDLCLNFPKGTTTAILGPSGCGKTTTLRILLGTDTSYEGEVRHRPERIGMVFQEPRLLPWRSIEENLQIVARSAGLPTEASRPLLEKVGLGRWGTRFPGELSLGMARRAAIARALIVQPELLLLDEPFVSLDEAAATGLRELVGNIIEERGITTVLVTHALEDALALADRTAILGPPPRSLRGLVDLAGLRAVGDMISLRAELAERLSLSRC